MDVSTNVLERDGWRREPEHEGLWHHCCGFQVLATWIRSGVIHVTFTEEQMEAHERTCSGYGNLPMCVILTGSAKSKLRFLMDTIHTRTGCDRTNVCIYGIDEIELATDFAHALLGEHKPVVMVVDREPIARVEMSLAHARRRRVRDRRGATLRTNWSVYAWEGDDPPAGLVEELVAFVEKDGTLLMNHGKPEMTTDPT